MTHDYHIHQPDPDNPDGSLCEYCEQPITQSPHGRRRRFGANRCRQAAWRMRKGPQPELYFERQEVELVPA
jgi:hypothetical protein